MKTAEERIADLEARLAQAEARLAELERVAVRRVDPSLGRQPNLGPPWVISCGGVTPGYAPRPSIMPLTCGSATHPPGFPGKAA